MASRDSIDRDREGTSGSQDTELSVEEARVLLEDYEAFVDEVRPGDGGRNDELRERMDRLIASLGAVSVPDGFRERTVDEITTWTRLLVMEGAHEKQGGPEAIRMLIHERMGELRELASLPLQENLE